jgi:hypothetical protein
VQACRARAALAAVVLLRARKKKLELDELGLAAAQLGSVRLDA